VTKEKPEELVKKNEKPLVKFPFAFISEENIPHISVVVQGGNTITFTMNLKTTSGSESDPAQVSPSVTLENLDPTISHEDLAQLPTKIFPLLLGWEGISCETLKLRTLFIDEELLEAIVTSGIKILHILNCTADPDLTLDLGRMEHLEELEASIPNFDDSISTPVYLKKLRVHCPKLTEDLKFWGPSLFVRDSESLGHV
jgi:hypothetical protein